MGNSFGFGERLRKARQAAGLSGEELGKGAGGSKGKDATKASVSDWEHERHYPKADQLRVICLKLNVSADELIFGDIKAQANMAQAKSAVQALTAEQRAELLRSLQQAPAPDHRVGQFIQPAPIHELASAPMPLEPTPPPRKRG